MEQDEVQRSDGSYRVDVDATGLDASRGKIYVNQHVTFRR